MIFEITLFPTDTEHLSSITIEVKADSIEEAHAKVRWHLPTILRQDILWTTRTGESKKENQS